MLIKESHQDVETSASGKGTMRIYLYHPHIPGYSRAKFPGVVVFSEIYQVTGPVARFARQIAGQGYIVAAPSSYHDFTSPDPLPYDTEGTDLGNRYKVEKLLPSYDQDSTLTISLLLSLRTCTGQIGTTGMCLGGHLAFRAAVVDREKVKAAVCFFATDLQGGTLGRWEEGKNQGKGDDSLARCGEIGGEVVMIFGKSDPHVPAAARSLIRTTLHDAGVRFSFYEILHAQHAFIRDESSKGRYDPAVTGVCFSMLLECFGRCLRGDLGERDGEVGGVGENVC